LQFFPLQFFLSEYSLIGVNARGRSGENSVFDGQHLRMAKLKPSTAETFRLTRCFFSCNSAENSGYGAEN
jgi:hypothetical protein